MNALRSLAFNLAFYLASAVMTLVTLPVFALAPEPTRLGVVRLWSKMGVVLLRLIVGTRLEVRGKEYMPRGGAIVASKHQSMFETFAIFTVLDAPAMVMKQELSRIPLWGWYTTRTGMIAIAREGGTATLRKLAADVKEATAAGRQVVIYPEGTRRTPGAEPDYKGGLNHLYRVAGAPVVPAATNSGLFWPRRKFMRYPGTIVIEFLPPIPPGLTSAEFGTRLQEAIETASDALLAEAARNEPVPPLPDEARARLAGLRA